MKALALIPLAAAAAVGTILIIFMHEHGRFPVGNGEVWNWLLGLGP